MMIAHSKLGEQIHQILTAHIARRQRHLALSGERKINHVFLLLVF